MPRSAPTADEARAPKRRRQWGCDADFGGAPIIGKTPTRRAVSGARFALFFTFAAWLTFVAQQVSRLLGADAGVGVRSVAEATIYMLVVTSLTASATAYLLARLGHLNRMGAHRRVPRSTIDDLFDEALPTLTVIVPAYREDARVVRQTLLSAALQEYPDLNVVLLIDDPQNPTDPEHRRLLEEARAVPAQVSALLAGPLMRFETALETFERSTATTRFAGPEILEVLAGHYEAGADWFSDQAAEWEIVDHSDTFVVMEVFERLATDFAAIADALRTASDDPDAQISLRRVHQLYRRLAWTFRTELSSFERKQFASLSHEANKAMNLNSYIGLMGGCYTVQSAPGGKVLMPAGTGAFDLSIPDPDYVLTLDADSTLLPEYCLRLVHFMQQPENADVGVAQTPYSAYRGAASRIERIAGATTDLQHLVHQGLTRYNATFWVGANAVLRKAALDQIVVEEHEDGFVVRRYVQDRTVIEDTESSIDLRKAGWRLYNYPERLSYSATPPDFGSLVVQRQRWANGGLVILPKMRGLWRRAGQQEGAGSARSGRASLAEMFLRVNYLASITWASLGLVVLLGYPFEERMLSAFAPLTALPYFVAVANDLRRTGYKRSDIFRLYGFNLLLLPVNLSGTVKSLVQAIGGQKIAFARTPKVRDRTVAALSFVVLPYLLLGWSTYTLLRDITEGAWAHAAFAGVNSVLVAYAIAAFVGLRASVVDVVVGLREWMYRPTKTAEHPQEAPHWVTVLYHGNALPEEHDRPAPLAVALAARDQAGWDAEAGPWADDDMQPASIEGGQVVFEVTAVVDEPDEEREAAADLLARCVEILAETGHVVLRPRGPSLEVSLEHYSTIDLFDTETQ